MKLLDTKLNIAKKTLTLYHNEIILNLPILPVDYTEKEIETFNTMYRNLKYSDHAYRRTTGILGELAEPEEGLTYSELISELKEKLDEADASNKVFNHIDNNITKKSIEGQKLIESLLR